jgi:hypothetical protein
MTDPLVLLEQAIPATERIDDHRLSELADSVPQAWKFWRGKGEDWAVFLVVGDHLSRTDQAGINSARRASASPVLIVRDFSGIRAASAVYRKLRPHLICDIAGRGTLIPAPGQFGRSRAPAHESATRVSLDLFQDLVDSESFRPGSRAVLNKLMRRYRRLSTARRDIDEKEAAILTQFAEGMLDDIGLEKNQIKATKMLRTIERGGLAKAGRDHFFHSFQNYFLGLRAVVELRTQFEDFKETKKLDWEVSPADVWFLTSMWHDVGYAVQTIGSVVDAILGDDDGDDVGDTLKERFLKRTATTDALRLMSSLMARMLSNARPRTGWFPPGPRTNLGGHAERLHEALRKNVLTSHGAASAVRLFCDYKDDLDKMDPDSATLLMQTVYLACCSIPLHDWRLRSAIRETCGECSFDTAAMPFAALLAFVDSIQDDRRDLGVSRRAVMILKRLLVKRPAVVEADIDAQAIPDEALLGKIVEAREVLAALRYAADGLQFHYPKWMSGQC